MPTVLVIDDVVSTRRLLRTILSEAHYEVHEAADGAQAMAMLDAFSIDAIILDLMMPNMNGWEFRECQLAEPRFARLPTVILTVKDLAEHERYGLRIEATTVLKKPVPQAAILEALDRIRFLNDAATRHLRTSGHRDS